MLDEIDGERIIWQDSIDKSTSFALTATRALKIESKKKKVANILQQCVLAGMTISIMNRVSESHGVRMWGTGLLTNTGKPMEGEHVNKYDVGDVLFFRNGQLQMRFDSVRKPDSVLELVKATTRQDFVSANTDEIKPETIEQQEFVSADANAIKPVAGESETELWRKPVVVPLQIGGRGFLHTKSVKAFYVISNLRASIVGAGKGRTINYFNTGDFYKTFLGISRPQIGSKRIDVPKGWKGGIIAECSLAGTQVAITERTEVTMPTHMGLTRDIKPTGDINFIVGGNIVLTFENVEGPDDIVALIERSLKRQN